MPNVPDYSQYVAVKKIRTSQTANANTSIVKSRAPYMYDGYFPLYRSTNLPVNALLSNKFTSGTGGAVALPFSPTNISGLTLWLDGTDPLSNGTPPADGASITTWFDKSGSGNNLTSAGTGTPTYVSATTNISYSGTSWLQRTGMTIPSTFTFYAVARKIGGDGPLYTNTTNPTKVDTGFFPNFLASAYLIRADGTWSITPTAFTNGTTYLYSITYDSLNNINVWGNGSLFVNTTQTGTITRDSILLGRRNIPPSALENWAGTFSEVLQYNTTPSTFQRQQIEGYLAWRWGLQSSLPVGHPYKLAKP